MTPCTTKTSNHDSADGAKFRQQPPDGIDRIGADGPVLAFWAAWAMKEPTADMPTFMPAAEHVRAQRNETTAYRALFLLRHTPSRPQILQLPSKSSKPRQLVKGQEGEQKSAMGSKPAWRSTLWRRGRLTPWTSYCAKRRPATRRHGGSHLTFPLGLEGAQAGAVAALEDGSPGRHGVEGQ